MINIIKKLNIEVSKPNVFQAVVAKQYDMNTRFIEATLVDGGEKVSINHTSTVTVVINALRADGESKSFDGVVNDDGTVTVPLHSWMLELEGTVICDISVMDIKADDNKKLTTTSFTLLVEKAANGGEGITSDPQYDLLVELLDRCDQADVMAKDALDKSNEANAKYEACVEATELAKDAANGVVTVEQNSKTPLKFWVGTQAEYDAIPTKDGTMFYIISDDTTEANFDEAIQDVKDAQQEIKDTNDKIVETFESYAPQDITSQLLDVNSSFAGSLQLIKSGKVFNLSLFKTGLQLFMRNGKGGTSLWDLCKLPEEIRPNKAIYIVPHIDLHPTYGELSRNKGNWIRINLDGTVQFLINFEISSSYDYVYFESVAFNTTYIV